MSYNIVCMYMHENLTAHVKHKERKREEKKEYNIIRADIGGIEGLSACELVLGDGNTRPH